DVLTGDAGANILDGGAGADRMAGGAGDDTYIVDNIGDIVTELPGGGTDTVKSSVSFTLGANVENLTLTGRANINAYGNSGANVLTGNAGHNTLSGGAGADTMIGGAGNDTYFVDNIGDKVIEKAGEGTDTVRASVSFTLGANVENLTLTGSANISGTGNGLANVLIGNAGNNLLDGGAGNDRIDGGAGNDTLKGGLGNDVLTGGAGHDTFVFDTALNARTNVDKITDFSVVDDVIHLDNAVFSALTATGVLADKFFAKNTTGLAQDANDHIIYETDTGKLFYDANGNAPGGSTHFATLQPNLTLTAWDFVII
ncbi:calcium-binding protein, partial [Rhizobiaceae sp. 2RAB30]